MSGLELVIFDCDGVLVDSERLAIRTEAQVLASLGWPLSDREIVERFVGRSAEYMHHEIENHLGRSVDWDREFETRYREVFARELCPVAGVEGALDRIDVPICVASSGTHAKINFSLGVTGLAGRFDGRIFSVEDVEYGKPAPDLFLYAGETDGSGPYGVRRRRRQRVGGQGRHRSRNARLRVCRRGDLCFTAFARWRPGLRSDGRASRPPFDRRVSGLRWSRR